MIAANKNLLKATLTQGVLGIQTELISLYTTNLSALGTQAALIAGFAFSSVITVVTPSDVSIVNTDDSAGVTTPYFFYIFFTISFISSLCVLSQATLVVTLGPSMALKGTTNDSVKIAASHMFRQLILIYKIAATAITSLFCGACVICWVQYPRGVASIATFLYFCGYGFLVYQGTKAYTIFEDAFIDSFDQGSSAPSALSNFIGGKTYKPVDSNNDEAIAKANEYIEATKLKARGIIWRRLPVEEGGLHVKCFAVMERGLLDFYKTANDFKEGGNPINKKPVKLWEVDLETDPRKYSKRVTNVRNLISAPFGGSEDFALSDLVGSEHDLKYAAKNYKFALVPKVASELAAVNTVEFIAHDGASYAQWIEAFHTVINAYDNLAINPSVEQTIRTGASDVETVVLAANNNA